MSRGGTILAATMTTQTSASATVKLTAPEAAAAIAMANAPAARRALSRFTTRKSRSCNASPPIHAPTCAMRSVGPSSSSTSPARIF